MGAGGVHFACCPSKMSKCKSILDFFEINSESEILDGPENRDHNEPLVPVTAVSCESQFVEDG